ncbi:MAG: PDZ domain-containing protein [Flavobacteriaceae bacterium]|nr:PDZ domain-containing protein [Flavobacteriaceae bacterium]
MKKFLHLVPFLFFFVLLSSATAPLISQNGFKLPDFKKKDRFSFKFINNLVLVPVELNGKELTFLLDTGVNYTLLFSLTENDSLEINNVTPVSIKGFGGGGDIQALKSRNNKMKIGDAVDKNHMVYVIFDKSINFSPRMGLPIHGVIGYDFFKDFIVKTDYDSRLLTIYDPQYYKQSSCRNCESFDIEFRKRKPYITNKVQSRGQEYEVVLLVDSGASDAVWLFDESIGVKEDPPNYFKDFLGLGLSGSVYGKRSKLDEVRLGKFKLENVNVSYPDSSAVEDVKLLLNRDGSLGADILKRFTVTMNYRERQMILRKNRFFGDPFHYNMAGIIVEHDGMVPVTNVKGGTGRSFRFGTDRSTAMNAVTIDVAPVLTFFLAPKYIIAEIRSGSPAAEAGLLKGDEVVSINGKPTYEYELPDITELFSSRSGKKILVEVNRDGKISKHRFVLKEVL